MKFNKNGLVCKMAYLQFEGPFPRPGLCWIPQRVSVCVLFWRCVGNALRLCLALLIASLLAVVFLGIIFVAFLGFAYKPSMDAYRDFFSPIARWPIKWRDGNNVWPILILALIVIAGMVGCMCSTLLWWGQFSAPNPDSPKSAVFVLGGVIATFIVVLTVASYRFAPDILSWYSKYSDNRLCRQHLKSLRIGQAEVPRTSRQGVAKSVREVGSLVSSFISAKRNKLCPIVELVDE